MRVCVDEARQHRDVAEIDVGLAFAVSADGLNAFAADRDGAVFQRRRVNWEYPACGERPGYDHGVLFLRRAGRVNALESLRAPGRLHAPLAVRVRRLPLNRAANLSKIRRPRPPTCAPTGKDTLMKRFL